MKVFFGELPVGSHRANAPRGGVPARTGRRKAERKQPGKAGVLVALSMVFAISLAVGWYFLNRIEVVEGIKVTATKPDTFEVNWKPNNADSYIVKVFEDKEGDEEIASVEARNAPATVSDLPILDPGTPVFVTVTTVKDGETETSKPIQTWLKPQKINTLSSPVASPNTVTLKWSETKNTLKYQIQRADNKEFTKGLATKITEDANNRIIIHGLNPDTNYYWRVRAINEKSKGDYSEPIKAATTAKTLDINIGTYNICSESCGGIKDRRWRMADLVAENDIDILALQEAGGKRVGPVVAKAFASQKTGLTRASGGAKTRYLFYDSKRFRQLDGDWFTFGRKVHGTTWAKFEDRRSGIRFIVASVHLSNNGSDTGRAEQTKKIFTEISKVNKEKLPVFFAGDFNSHRRHRLDGPEEVMNSKGYVNALELVDGKAVNAEVTSFRSFSTQIKRKGLHVDKVYVPKGTKIKSWKLFFKSSNGKYSGGKFSDHNPLKAEISIKIANPK